MNTRRALTAVALAALLLAGCSNDTSGPESDAATLDDGGSDANGDTSAPSGDDSGGLSDGAPAFDSTIPVTGDDSGVTGDDDSGSASDDAGQDAAADDAGHDAASDDAGHDAATLNEAGSIDAAVDAPVDSAAADAAPDSAVDASDAAVCANPATDCPAPTTTCATAICVTATQCGTNNASLGTPCTDDGGIVCDGKGACVATHCMDGTTDADETDRDCGGSCAPCGDSKHCKVFADCVNDFCFAGTCVSCGDGTKDGNETGVDCGGAQCDALNQTCGTGTGCGTATDCTSGYCMNGVTCALRPNGNACNANAQCASFECVGSLCCDKACNGTCEACAASLTGQPDGACKSILPGFPAPAGQCTAAPPCGNDGKCNGTSACELTPVNTSCAPASCTSATFTNASICDGSGTCNAGATSSCANGCSTSGICNVSTPSFSADATGSSSAGAVSLDKEANLDASNGAAPAVAPVVPTITTSPNNGYQSVTLNWTNDNFATVTPVTCTLGSQSGGVDSWGATIPAQSAATTVRFYYQAVQWGGASDYNPGNNVNYTYVTQ